MRIPGVTLTGLATFGALACGLVFSGTPAFAAPPETPVTKPATAIAGTTATLNGELNPAKSATAAYDFTYNTNATCTEGTTTAPGAEKTGKAIKVSTPLTGLEGSTEYTFCVVATHTEAEVTESTPGSPLKFVTLAAKPVVDSESSSGLTPFVATLEAQVNPENQATNSCMFQYGPTNKYGTTAECAQPPLEGSSDQLATASLNALKGATTYHYRVVVKNATGETKGADAKFTTLAEERPIVDGESVSGLTATGSKLEAQVNPNYQETTYDFEYATNEALTGATTVAGAEPIPAGFGDQPATAEIAGLQTRTTYYYRVVATNKTGTTGGTVEHFATLATPAVTTGAASTLTRTSALLTGTVNPAGAATTYHFAYIEQTAYEAAVAAKAANPYAAGATTPESASVGSDYTVHAVGPLQVSELKPGVSYHYAVVAANSVGTTTDPAGATFTTSAPTPPVAVTGEAIGVAPNSATITGAVDARELPTTLQFEFGTSPTPGQGSLVPASVVPNESSGSSVAISDVFSGSLQEGTTYYYRTVATNSDGTSYGANKSFTTGAFPGLPAATPAELIAWPAFVAAELAAGERHGSTNMGPPAKPLTKAQKLAAALKACKKRVKSKRAACKARARKQYAVKQKATSKKK